MALRDRLFGRKLADPPPVTYAPVKRTPSERLAKAQRGAGRGFSGLFSTLRGGAGTAVRVCPTCSRQVGDESETCPVGHYVG